MCLYALNSMLWCPQRCSVRLYFQLFVEKRVFFCVIYVCLCPTHILLCFSFCFMFFSQFLWTVLFLFLLWYSLTFIKQWWTAVQPKSSKQQISHISKYWTIEQKTKTTIYADGSLTRSWLGAARLKSVTGGVEEVPNPHPFRFTNWIYTGNNVG
jgi:hypothetical protein